MNIFFYIVIFLAIFLEPFPISSSGNVSLLMKLFPFFPYSSELFVALEFFLHGPTACAIASMSWSAWRVFLKKPRKSFSLMCTIIFFGAITESITLLLYGIVHKSVTLYALSFGFLCTALILLSLRFCPQPRVTKWNCFYAAIMGIAQGIAFFPGVSRFAATYALARWLGLSAKRAFYYSFLLVFPISVTAFLLGSIKLSMLHAWDIFSVMSILIIVLATMCAMFAFWWVRDLALRDRLWIFCGYVLVLSIVALVL